MSQQNYKLTMLQEDFASLTKQFDLEDWRTVRTPHYWLSDKMDRTNSLQHKINLINYYNNKGIPLK
jgi:hypothetical protein